jgi:hypothetical protein
MSHRDEQIEKKFQAIEAEASDSSNSSTDQQRIIDIDKPDVLMSHRQWVAVIKANYPDLLFAAELGLAIMAQILIVDITNPFALVLVDVPSAGKTIVLNFFAEIDGLTYASDKFSPASFVSNAANVKKSKLPEIDLLPRLRYKMLLIRDMATVFSKREDELNETLGTLTRVLDGEGLNTDTGVHGQRQYVGEYLFMVLAASTPIQPRVWKVMGNLGSRLFFLNMNSKGKTDDELADQLGSTTYKDKEIACQLATRQLLQSLWSKHPKGMKWDSDNDDRKLKIILVRCARLLAHLRGVVNVYSERHSDGTEYVYQTPVIEKPDRINQLFYNLARGHAIGSGRTKISQDDVRPVIELAIDSAPTTRTRLFRELLDVGGEITTTQVEELLNCSKPTALKEMEMLKILKLCSLTQDSQGYVGEPEKTLKLKPDFEWFLSDECKGLRGLPINKANPAVCSTDDQSEPQSILDSINKIFPGATHVTEESTES